MNWKQKECFMMNKKGQVLVTFVLILPLILMFVGLIIDIGNNLVLRKRAENAIRDSIIYGFKDEYVDINDALDLIEKNIKKNIDNYDELKLNIKEEILEVKLKMTYKSLFGSVFNTGLNKIELNIKYNIEEKRMVREWLYGY